MCAFSRTTQSAPTQEFSTLFPIFAGSIHNAGMNSLTSSLASYSHSLTCLNLCLSCVFPVHQGARNMGS